MGEPSLPILSYDIASSPASMPPPSSSPSRRPPRYGPNGQKERRKASITPRKFHRFFEPRAPNTINVGSTRRTLFDVTSSVINRNGIRSSPVGRAGDQESVQDNVRWAKRRRLGVIDVQQENNDGPTWDLSSNPSTPVGLNSNTAGDIAVASPVVSKHNGYPCFGRLTKKIERLEDLAVDKGIAGRMTQLSIGSSTKSRRQHYVYPVADYQDETSKFYSRPEDVHDFNRAQPDLADLGIPFCTAACHTNTLVAFGDERGQIRFVESAKDATPQSFSTAFLSFKPHNNAVIDLVFSADDSLLASGCGDRSVNITEMATQTVVRQFQHHESSVKQVRWQPGSHNNSILASSGRDGNVLIYDLRCGTTKAELVINETSGDISTMVNEIVDAHRPGDQPRGRLPYKSVNKNWLTAAERAQPVTPTGEKTREYGPISITALEFLPGAHSHLLITGSEFTSSMKVWDIRSVPRRTELAVPITTCQPPASHKSHRHAGITSIAVSGDGARIYATSRDNAIYAYSTSHLVTGKAPELSSRTLTKAKRPPLVTHHEGPGPLYAFRHPLLMVNSFYVKSAIRPARNGQAEMLAVGSTDQCAVLFPTDERYFETAEPNLSRFWPAEQGVIRSVDYTLRSTPRGRKARRDRALARELESEEGLLMSERGTPLVEGHSREVSSVVWTHNGDLITVGDDYLARCWRDGRMEIGAGEDTARELRRAGNAGGKRWGCGWADVNDKSYDDSDVEDDE